MRGSILVKSWFRPIGLLLMAVALMTGIAACRASDSNGAEDGEKYKKDAAARMRAMMESGGPSFNGVKLHTGPYRTPKDMDGLTIAGYNYTDTYIGNFAVNGAGGGNIEVSTETSGGGGGTCCASISADTPLPTTVEISWKRDGDVPWCKQTVLVQGPVPEGAHYFEVHFYQDGRIETAITKETSWPRVKLDRFNPAFRKASGNVVNDTKYGTCGHG